MHVKPQIIMSMIFFAGCINPKNPYLGKKGHPEDFSREQVANAQEAIVSKNTEEPDICIFNIDESKSKENALNPIHVN